MKRIFFVLGLGLFTNLAHADDVGALKKIIAVQEAQLTRQQAQITSLLKDSAELKARLDSLKSSQEKDVKAVNDRINNVLSGNEKFGQITFGNNSKIIQDQGLSMFTVNERNGKPSPYYFHFGTSIEAWEAPYNGNSKLIWAW